MNISDFSISLSKISLKLENISIKNSVDQLIDLLTHDDVNVNNVKIKSSQHIYNWYVYSYTDI